MKAAVSAWPTACCAPLRSPARPAVTSLPWGPTRTRARAQVLGSGQGTYDHATNARALNTVNPPRRDTATLPKEGWVVVRFEATNPGVWLLHW